MNVKNSIPQISVIVPIHHIPSEFDLVRKQIHKATSSVEIIYVINKEIQSKNVFDKSNEKIIYRTNFGRGFMQLEGLREARGEIVVFLHADTLLPNNWDKKILEAMDDKSVIGGAFSLSFDKSNFYLRIGIFIVTYLFHLTGILSGDRSIFVRRNTLLPESKLLEVPIYEDAELSQWMKSHGEVVLLDDVVITSSKAFIEHGMIQHTWRIIFASLRYRLGDDLQKIFRYYYH